MALAEPPDISTGGNGALKGDVVNVKMSIVVPALIGITALGLIGHRLSVFNRIKNQPEYRHQTAPQTEKTDLDSIWNKRNTNAARRYIERVQAKDTAESENPGDRVTENQAAIWETRILDYARSQALNDIDTTRVHKLAGKTADLFQMLKTASRRKEKGMEPYTGFTGFATMARVMAMEEEFQKVIGVTFSDFMGTLDTAFIKDMAESE
jgi:hypothetical protein